MCYIGWRCYTTWYVTLDNVAIGTRRVAQTLIDRAGRWPVPLPDGYRLRVTANLRHLASHHGTA
jgi:hypothetical protein